MIEQGDLLISVDGKIKQITPNKNVEDNPLFQKVECILVEYKDGKLFSEKPLSFYTLK